MTQVQQVTLAFILAALLPLAVHAEGPPQLSEFDKERIRRMVPFPVYTKKPPPSPGQIIGTAMVTTRDAYGGYAVEVVRSTLPAGSPLPQYQDIEGKWSITVEGEDYVYSYEVNNPIDRRNLKPWPKLHEVVLRATATAQGDQYVYAYSVYCSPRNTIGLSSFGVDLRKDPSDHPLSYQHLSRRHTADDHSAALQGERIDPIEIVMPPGWIGGRRGWSVAGLIEARYIRPGGHLNGFKLIVREPAGIREFSANGDSEYWFNNAHEYQPPPRDPDEPGEITINKGIEYIGKTIAPVAPPEPFTVGSWTARMLADAEEARRQGWIKSDKQLAAIQSLIEGLKVSDEGTLKSSVREIERYVGKEVKAERLTSEADALIRLNALYLLGRVEKDPKILKQE